MAVSIDQQFVEYIVKSLVGHPDEVKIERRIDEKGVLLELSVNPEDLGRVIGKRGSTAQSLRTLLRALGTKNDARYNLKIVDTGPPPEDRRPKDDKPLKDKDEKPEDDESTNDVDEVDASKNEVVDEPTDEIDMADDEELPESATDHSDVISRTRKELEDLDDLDL